MAMEVSIKEEINYFGRLKSPPVEGTYGSHQNAQLFSEVTLNFGSLNMSNHEEVEPLWVIFSGVNLF
jgi:hypothetical protein